MRLIQDRLGSGSGGEEVDDVPDGGFDAFVLSRGTALLRFAHVLTGDRTLGEDLVQEALVKAHRHWDRVVAADRPEAYVRRIVVNEFTSWRRRGRNTETPVAAVYDLLPDGVLPDGTSPQALVDRDAVWRALAGLPPRQHAVLVLRYYEDLPDEQIAGLLGCATATVRSLAFRALAALRLDPSLIVTAEEDR